MAFGALAAYAFNGPLGTRPMVVAALLAMVATAVLSLVLDAVLWRPLRRRRAGFMSLFLASIGLALVLRQVAPARVRTAAAAATTSTRTRSTCSAACGCRRRSSSRSLTAAAIDRRVGLFLARTTLGRTMRALADDRALAAIAGIDVGRVIALDVDPLRPARRRSPACSPGSSQYDLRPELRLPAAAAGVRRGRARRDRQRLRRARRRARARASRWSSRRGRRFFGGVDPVYKPVVAFVVLAAALMVRPQGLFGRARVV